MISENIKILIDKLKKKTESGQAIWTKTSRDTEFKLELQKGAIVTDNWEDGQGFFVDLAILNENGEIIERDFFNVNEEDYKTLYEVYLLAKNSYYKVDETLKTIFDELDSPKIVGKDKNKDLPF
ncbi:Protein of unknown function [Flavobacterium indicum GPTSA100-9 = DSM 17447]|uniref:Uncharacterized protein n=1 Tax=Flavobacterium indicum (strain DSM 17447 / CIP 109464 / GPTSA100-9) TaxID=1094466 RepID=H8XTW8_FLAIG|nr:hypothetical protein [Flavobacterium indicum]CCG53698.1 Protein of unknown function [Flavobacterium indicum GPTSA100-9 = DSM 17447]